MVAPPIIENLPAILAEFEPPKRHPSDPRYKEEWRALRKKLIEGVWVEQFGKWRYVPGRLGFYAKHCVIIDTDKKTKSRYKTSPSIRDLEWIFAYLLTECFGFSGFEDDNIHTAALQQPSTLEEEAAFFNNKGFPKQFKPARELLFELHDRPLGRPLYNNQSRNLIILGARGSGKSFSVGLMGAKYQLIFDGAKYVEQVKSRAEVNICAGSTSKSSELISKIVDSLDEMTVSLGTYGDIEDSDYTPSPLYKTMSGTLKPNNGKDPWRNEYLITINGKTKKRGSGSALYHKVISPNKKDAAEEGAGGRRDLIIYEEIGLMELFIEAMTSDEAVVTTSGEQFGVQIGLGTSGNIDLIRPAQKVFTHPNEYRCLDFNGTGYFIPAYLADRRFKDENGNTRIEEAKAFYQEKRKQASLASDPRVLLAERMNNPIEIEDMWLGGSSSLLPSKEAEQREKQLIEGNLYEKLGTAIDLYIDSKALNKVNYNIIPLSKSKQIKNWPLDPGASREGEFMMYIHPELLKINGIIPPDAVIVLHDPYVSEDDKGKGSLGATYFIVNPKYASYGLPPYAIAATYIGKHPLGVDHYNDIVLKGIWFYGINSRSVYYEANRGDKFRAFMLRKKMGHVLCLRPQFEQGSFVYRKNVTQTGYIVGDRIAKITLIDSFNDILLTQPEQLDTTVLEAIPCLFTIKQIKNFDLDGNFDGVSALLGLSLAVNEQTHYQTQRLGKPKVLSALTKHMRHA